MMADGSKRTKVPPEVVRVMIATMTLTFIALMMAYLAIS